jgi:hypothetical protein
MHFKSNNKIIFNFIEKKYQNRGNNLMSFPINT